MCFSVSSENNLLLKLYTMAKSVHFWGLLFAIALLLQVVSNAETFLPSMGGTNAAAMLVNTYRLLEGMPTPS